MIFHITTLTAWLSQKNQPGFAPSDFQREGFIHCSTHEQVQGVLDRYFQNQTDLVLLHIDETKLTAVVKYEPSTIQELFPHVYGPINMDAIVRTENLKNG
jgi:uncharacterized protein (DUF952 family)